MNADLAPEPAFTCVRLSPPGVVCGVTRRDPLNSSDLSPSNLDPAELDLSSAVALVNNKGGVEIYVQDDGKKWNKHIDMTARLIAAYEACNWASRVLTATANLPVAAERSSSSSSSAAAEVALVPAMSVAERRLSCSIASIAWSARCFSPDSPPFILFAMGSRTGIVTIWKIGLPLLSINLEEQEQEIHASVGEENENKADAAASSSSATVPPVLVSAPELVCCFAPAPSAATSSSSSSPSAASFFITQLSFSPFYYDAARQTTICSLAVGTSLGQVHLYAMEPFSATHSSASPSSQSSAAAASSSSAAAASSSSVPQLPLTAHWLSSVKVGASFMSVLCLEWSELVSDPVSSQQQKQALSSCNFCFGAQGCRLNTKPAVSGRGAKQQQSLVHHMLAIACGGNIKVVSLHPQEYLSFRPANAIESAHPSVCQVFAQDRAHFASVHSLVWSIQASSSLHAVVADSSSSSAISVADDPSRAALASSSSALSTCHVQLLSSSLDDVTHRWILRDTADSINEPNESGMEEAKDAAASLQSRKLICFDSTTVDAIAAFDGFHSPLPSPPSLLQANYSLFRSADSLLLFSFDWHYSSALSAEALLTNDTEKCTQVGVVQVQPFPYLEFSEQEQRELQRLTIECSQWDVDPQSAQQALVAAADAGANADGPAFRSAASTPHSYTPTEAAMMAEMTAAELADRKRKKPQELRSSPGIVSMEIESPSPAPAASSSSSAAAVATTAGEQASKPSRSLMQIKQEAGTPSRPKRQQPKKRRKIGAADEDEDDDDDEEWKEDDGEGGASDDSDESYDDEEEEAEEDELDNSDEEKRAKKKSRSASKSGFCFTPQQILQFRSAGTRFKHMAQVPIPKPVQSSASDAERKRVQKSMIKKLIAIWFDQVAQCERRRRIKSSSGSSDSHSAPPLAVSLFGFRTCLHSFCNPEQLSISPAFSQNPSINPEAAVLYADPPLPSATPPTKVEKALHRFSDLSPTTPYYLLWKILGEVVPPAGFRNIFQNVTRTSASSAPVYPIEAFSLPLHKQIPFLFLADTVLEAAQELGAKKLEQLAASASSASGEQTQLMDTAWLEEEAASNGLRSPYEWRLVLLLLSIALSARTPYLSLDHTQRIVAQRLQQSILRMCHLQALRRSLQYVHSTYVQATDNATKQSFLLKHQTSILLMCDLFMSNILGDSEQEPLLQRQIWAQPSVLPLLRLLHDLYGCYGSNAAAETAWLSHLFSLIAAADSRTAAKSSRSRAVARQAPLPALIEQERSKWKQSTRINCICQAGKDERFRSVPAF